MLSVKNKDLFCSGHLRKEASVVSIALPFVTMDSQSIFEKSIEKRNKFLAGQKVHGIER